MSIHGKKDGAYHDIQSDEKAGFVDSLANVVTLSESQTTSDRGASAGSNGRVQTIDIEAQVDR